MAIVASETRAAGSQLDMLARQFVGALVQQDFVQLATYFSPDIRFRALVPRGLREASTPEDASHYFQGWFGAADRIELVEHRNEPMVDRQHMAWRLRVHDAAGQRLVEQQVYATVRDGTFVAFDLLCSGFRLESVRPEAFEIAATLDGGDAACATLTPMIATRLRSLEHGQVLEVVTSEPTAAADLASWTKLTGNELLDTRVAGDEQRYYIRRKKA
jgi:TusA-related sulfurtransferase